MFELRDYQIEAVERLRKNKRMMLLDAPGLGKTPQAMFAAEGETLITAPALLISQWRDWILGEDEESLIRNNGVVIPNIHHSDSVALVTGTPSERAKALDSGAYWTIISQESLSGTLDDWLSKQTRWQTFIIDESHHLKSHNGKRARTAVKIAKNCEYVYELTATPIRNQIDDLFMQFRILQPDVFTSYWRFVNTFCVAEQGYFGVQILGPKKSMQAELTNILDMMSIGRTYEDAKRELPPILPKYLKIDLPKSIREAYDEAINYWRLEDTEDRLTFTNAMQVYHLLRQFCTGSFKADAISEILEDTPTDIKSVIFSWYRETAESIAKELGIEPVTGKISAVERRVLAKSQQVTSATISSLTEGVDLSAARNVIFAEEDYTPGANYQAISRVRRERQHESNDEPIVVTYVHCRNTIDEVIHRTAMGRGATAKEVVKSTLYL